MLSVYQNIYHGTAQWPGNNEPKRMRKETDVTWVAIPEFAWRNYERTSVAWGRIVYVPTKILTWDQRKTRHTLHNLRKITLLSFSILASIFFYPGQNKNSISLVCRFCDFSTHLWPVSHPEFFIIDSVRMALTSVNVQLTFNLRLEYVVRYLRK
jgi:hypothetical protein